jgi:hypothetical protein
LLCGPGFRPAQVFHRLGYVAAAVEVMGQLGQMILQPIAKQILDRLGRAFVQQPAALDKHRVVGNFLGQGMLESVFDIGKGRLLVDELGQPQQRKCRLQFVV